jgi:hypothetical protein
MMNQVTCNHDWIREKGDYNIKYIYYPSQKNRVTCSLCDWGDDKNLSHMFVTGILRERLCCF